MNENQFTFYEDAGHGWLEVPTDLLRELGLLNSISDYSYARANSVYLEEDRDLSIFIDAWEKKIGKNFEFEKVKKIYHENSPIREFEHLR